MNIYHVSSSKRSDGNAGGVEKFSWYLQKAIGCELLYPHEAESKRPHMKRGDIIIGDGYHVCGFDPTYFHVISIVHGSWMEFAIRNGKLQDFRGEADRQGGIWKNPNIKKVSVSQSAAKYLKLHHNVDTDKIILNSIDTDLFKPIEHKNDKPVIIYAANDYNKDGQGRLGKIAGLLEHKFEFRYLSADIGEEHIKYAQGDLYIQCSFYEGNAFASVEAMSCGLPVIASRTGLFEDTDLGNHVGETVEWNASAEDFAKAIEYVWSNKNIYNPREWVINNANFGKFKKDWQDYIGYLEDL